MVLLTYCGQEVDFVEAYGQLVREKGVNVVTLYDSPTCVALLNYQTSKFNQLTARNRTDFSFMYKMVPVDSALTEANYAIYSNKLSQMIKANLNQTKSVSLLQYFSLFTHSKLIFGRTKDLECPQRAGRLSFLVKLQRFVEFDSD